MRSGARKYPLQLNFQSPPGAVRVGVGADAPEPAVGGGSPSVTFPGVGGAPAALPGAISALPLLVGMGTLVCGVARWGAESSGRGAGGGSKSTSGDASRGWATVEIV